MDDVHQIVPFSSVLSIVNGKNQKAVEDEGGQYPIYGSGGEMGRANDYLCDADTVIIGRKGSINNPIYVEEPFWNVDTAFGLVADREKLLPKYLYYFCVKFDFTKLNTTVTIPSLTKANLLKVNIPLLPLAEQKRIAEVLDKISAMKRNAEARVQKLDLLVKSRFVEMFGTIEDGKFPLASLGGICEFIKDGTHQTPTYTTDIAHGYKFLSSKDVTTGHIDWTHIKYIPADLHEELYKRIAPRRNDILLAKNGTTGIAALVDTDEVFDIYVSLALLRFKQGNDVRYLLAAINSSETKRQFDSHLKGIGVPNLHLGEIKKAQIPIPPLALQREFAAFVEKVEKLKATAQRECEQVDLLYRAKLQEYFG